MEKKGTPRGSAREGEGSRKVQAGAGAGAERGLRELRTIRLPTPTYPFSRNIAPPRPRNPIRMGQDPGFLPMSSRTASMKNQRTGAHP